MPTAVDVNPSAKFDTVVISGGAISADSSSSFVSPSKSILVELDQSAKKYSQERPLPKQKFFSAPETIVESDLETERARATAYKAFLTELKRQLHESNKDSGVIELADTSKTGDFIYAKWVPNKFKKSQQKLVKGWLTMEQMLDDNIASLNRTSAWIKLEENITKRHQNP